MVRQTQKVDQLRESKGVLGESSLREPEKENGWGWLSRIATFFKGLGRPRVDNQVGKKVVRNRRAILAKKSDRVAKPTRIRSDDKSKAGGKATGKTVRSAATKNKAKSKALPKG